MFLTSTTNAGQYEFQMIRIQLTNNDGKDYYLTTSFGENTIDIIDFYNNRVIGRSQFDLFGYSSWSSIFYSILELKNEDKTYMFCFIGNNNNIHYISLQKFKFNNANIIEENRTLQSVTKKTALELVLKSDKKMLTAEIIQEQIRSANGTKNTYTITSSDGIAFDHAKIIAYALQRLRGKIEYTDIALNLMPELFTLTQLQQVYEIILNRQLIKAPFRRKYGLLAEPTDETTSDEGHRPSRLFRRKWL